MPTNKFHQVGGVLVRALISIPSGSFVIELFVIVLMSSIGIHIKYISKKK